MTNIIVMGYVNFIESNFISYLLKKHKNYNIVNLDLFAGNLKDLKETDNHIYGDSKNIRGWLNMFEHCKGVVLAYHKGKSGKTYNIGGRNERTNLQMVDRICSTLDEKVPLKERTGKESIMFAQDRVRYDRCCAIDTSKIENELGSKADENFDSEIVKTIERYLEKYK